LKLWGLRYLELEEGPDKSNLTTPSMYVHPTISRDFTGTNDEVASKILAPLAERSERRVDLSILASRSERSQDLSLLSSKSERNADVSILAPKKERRLPFQ
jgi:hypothetical protein